MPKKISTTPATPTTPIPTPEASFDGQEATQALTMPKETTPTLEATPATPKNTSVSLERKQVKLRRVAGRPDVIAHAPTTAPRLNFPESFTTPVAFSLIFGVIFGLASLFAFTSNVPSMIDSPAVFIRAALLDSESVVTTSNEQPDSAPATSSEPAHAAAAIVDSSALQRTLFIALVTTGCALFFFAILLRVRARAIAGPGAREDGFDLVNRLPVLGIVEVSTFLWVISSLALAVYYILTTFADNKDMIFGMGTAIPSELGGQTIMLLFFLSFVCGLLGGALYNLKFFLASGVKANKRFDARYIYRYLANPFFSSVIGFFAFLIMVNFKIVEAEKAAQLGTLSFIFVFVLVGYFSEIFVALLHNLVKRARVLFEDKFDQALDQIADDHGKASKGQVE